MAALAVVVDWPGLRMAIARVEWAVLVAPFTGVEPAATVTTCRPPGAQTPVVLRVPEVAVAPQASPAGRGYWFRIRWREQAEVEGASRTARSSEVTELPLESTARTGSAVRMREGTGIEGKVDGWLMVWRGSKLAAVAQRAIRRSWFGYARSPWRRRGDGTRQICGLTSSGNCIGVSARGEGLMVGVGRARSLLWHVTGRCRSRKPPRFLAGPRPR